MKFNSIIYKGIQKHEKYPSYTIWVCAWVESSYMDTQLKKIVHKF